MIKPVRVRTAVTALALLGLLAACGSRVPESVTAGADSGAGQAGGGPTATGSTGSTGATGSTGSGGSGPAAAGATTSGSSGAAFDNGASAAQSFASGSSAPGRSVAYARGVTATTITVGVSWIDVSQLAATFAPTSSVDGSANQKQITQIQAIADWINKHGGIAGKKLLLVFHEYPVQALTNSSEEAQAEQSTCDDFTQDHPSFAAIPLVDGGTFVTCAAQRGLITFDIGSQASTVDPARFAQIGHVWYRPDWITGDRRETDMVTQMARRGFFKPKGKVGLMVIDDPPTRKAVQEALLPAMARIGVKPASTYYYTPFDNASSAVLQFKTAGVDEVFWSQCSCGGLITAQFMNQSQAQHYTPVNAVTTDLGPNNLSTLGAPKAQLQNTVGIGWNPDFDGVPVDASIPSNTERQNCDASQKAAGMAPGSYDGLFQYCEALLFLMDAVNSQAAQLTTPGFRTAVEHLGSSYSPASTFSASFGPGRHDGATAVRDLNYGAACSCWSYGAGVYPVG